MTEDALWPTLTLCHADGTIVTIAPPPPGMTFRLIDLLGDIGRANFRLDPRDVAGAEMIELSITMLEKGADEVERSLEAAGEGAVMLPPAKRPDAYRSRAADLRRLSAVVEPADEQAALARAAQRAAQRAGRLDLEDYDHDPRWEALVDHANEALDDLTSALREVGDPRTRTVEWMAESLGNYFPAPDPDEAEK